MTNKQDQFTRLADSRLLVTEATDKAASNTLAALARARAAAAGRDARAAAWTIVPIADAWASSAIEGVETTPQRMLEAAAAGTGAQATQSAISCEQATREAWQRGVSAKDSTWPSTAAAVAAGRRLAGSKGQLRTAGVNVRIANHWGETLYTPPAGGGAIATLLEALWDALDADSATPRIIRTAASHLVYEKIHPLADGNGRTGRILIAALLRHYQLGDVPVCAPAGRDPQAPGRVLPPTALGTRGQGLGEMDMLHALKDHGRRELRARPDQGSDEPRRRGARRRRGGRARREHGGAGSRASVHAAERRRRQRSGK